MVFCRTDTLTSRNTANVMIMRTVITRKSQPVIRNVMDFLNFIFNFFPLSDIPLTRAAHFLPFIPRAEHIPLPARCG